MLWWFVRQCVASVSMMVVAVVVGGRRGELSGGDLRSSQISRLEKPDRRFCTALGGEGRTETSSSFALQSIRRHRRGDGGLDGGLEVHQDNTLPHRSRPFPALVGRTHTISNRRPATAAHKKPLWGGGGHRASSSGSGAQRWVGCQGEGGEIECSEPSRARAAGWR